MGTEEIVLPQLPQNRAPGRSGFPQYGQVVVDISDPPQRLNSKLGIHLWSAYSMDVSHSVAHSDNLTVFLLVNMIVFLPSLEIFPELSS